MSSGIRSLEQQHSSASDSGRNCNSMSQHPIRSFRDLEVWQIAMDLVVSVYKVANRFPSSEKFELSAQVRRAAVSVPSNIAEGHAQRRSRKTYLRHVVGRARHRYRACRAAPNGQRIGRPVGRRGDPANRAASARPRAGAESAAAEHRNGVGGGSWKRVHTWRPVAPMSRDLPRALERPSFRTPEPPSFRQL
jgi:23S rRNA-intervening sequence protein